MIVSRVIPGRIAFAMVGVWRVVPRTRKMFSPLPSAT
jgi:hypothetical protein